MTASKRATGSQAIKQMLQPKSIIRSDVQLIHPTVDKYGDPESPTPVNGVVKQIKVTQAPEATSEPRVPLLSNSDAGGVRCDAVFRGFGPASDAQSPGFRPLRRPEP